MMLLSCRELSLSSSSRIGSYCPISVVCPEIAILLPILLNRTRTKSYTVHRTKLTKRVRFESLGAVLGTMSRSLKNRSVEHQAHRGMDCI